MLQYCNVNFYGYCITHIEHYVKKIDAKLDQLICNVSLYHLSKSKCYVYKFTLLNLQQSQGLARQAHPQYRQAEVTAAMRKYAC